MKKILGLASVLLLAAVATAQTANTSLPSGTSLHVKLSNTLTSYSSKSGDPFSGKLMDAIDLDGQTVFPAGSTVQGRVTKVDEPRRIKGKPTIAILPESITLPTGEIYKINASLVDTNLGHGTDVNKEGQFKGAGHDRRDQVEIGAGTAGGMLVGGLIGGPVGMVVGGGVGAGATSGHWLIERKSAVLPAGTELWMELNRPLDMAPAAAGQ